MSEEHKDMNDPNGQMVDMSQQGDRGQGEDVFDGMLTTQSSSFRSFEFKDETKATHWRAKGYVVPRNVNAETLGSPPSKRATKRKTAPTKIVHADGQNWMKYGQKVVKRSDDMGGCIQRHYYRCSYDCCPAKKWVERPQGSDATDDEGALVIKYLGEHSHDKKLDKHGGRRCEVKDEKEGHGGQMMRIEDGKLPNGHNMETLALVDAITGVEQPMMGQQGMQGMQGMQIGVPQYDQGQQMHQGLQVHPGQQMHQQQMHQGQQVHPHPEMMAPGMVQSNIVQHPEQQTPMPGPPMPGLAGPPDVQQLHAQTDVQQLHPQTVGDPHDMTHQIAQPIQPMVQPMAPQPTEPQPIMAQPIMAQPMGMAQPVVGMPQPLDMAQPEGLPQEEEI